MPQLNPEFFASQIFWLAISFVLLYLAMAVFALPRIGRVLDDRAGRIKGDLDRAETLRSDAEAARLGYEAALNDARLKAQAISSAARVAMTTEADRRKAELAAALAAETSSAETAIAAAKSEALAGLRDAASEACQAIVEKVGGLKLSSETVRAAVDAELSGEAK